MTTEKNTPKETASTAVTATEKSEKKPETVTSSTASYASSWPEDCLWPEPYRQSDLPPTFDLDEIEEIAETSPLDEECKELLEIKEYFDSLVAEGVLVREDGTYKIYEDEDGFVNYYPEKGEQYWVDRIEWQQNDEEDTADKGGYFDIESWLEDISALIHRLKLETPPVTPIPFIEPIIGYQFINENLLRQAFTRRSFGIEYKVGDSEQLEFIGDSVLNTVVTRVMVAHLTETNADEPERPFQATIPVASVNDREIDRDVKPLDEGDFTKIRNKFVNKEYLAERAASLGLDKFILYGSVEEPSTSAREDLIEAIIGAVAIDSDWDWEVLERVVDSLINVQVSNPTELLKATFYETFNKWHQRKFGRIPDYHVYQKSAEITAFKTAVGTASASYYPQEGFTCRINFSIPENEQGLETEQVIEAQASSRSQAREFAAEFAYYFVVKHRLWSDLRRDAGIEPNLQDSINQLQELNQKGYVDKPEYEFKDFGGAVADWSCKCLCSGVYGHGRDKNKTQAKKQAAFEVLEKLFDSQSQQSSEQRAGNSSSRDDNSANSSMKTTGESEGKKL
ncbi:MAG: hypothetical protein IJ587_12050 [Synergistaceae bacterium]|nr:hypothetical protein [Synergistaceae bacterium]